MLPKTHIILGAVFGVIVKIAFPSVDWTFIILMFLASFLIDFDHYAFAVTKTHSLSLIKALRWFDNHIQERQRAGRVGPKARKSPFFLLHTIEFHLLILLLSYFWIGFLYIFIGMVFHSLLDICAMTYKRELHARWFSLIEWLIKRGKE